MRWLIASLPVLICLASLFTSRLGLAQTAASPQDLTQARELNLDVKLMFPSPVPDRIILNLTPTPETSVAVNWRTDTTVTQGVVEVAKSTDGTQFTELVARIPATTEYLRTKHEQEPAVSAHYHSAVMDGLTPGQVYVYRVGSGQSWSEWFQFKVPVSTKGREISFLYFGDAQNDVKSHWSRVIREAYKKMPEVDFMLHAGDLINRHDHDIEWGEWFQAGSFIHATVPSIMTPGNHEYRNVKLSPHWRPQYNLPRNGPAGLEETCYQINFHDLKVISLDAEQIDESKYFAEKQAQWLDSILTNDPRRWTVLTIHYPFYSTKPNRDNEELRQRFKPILDKHKVDIVLQGHDHAYGRGMVSNSPSGQNRRVQQSGTMYVVSVSGPKMYDLSEDPWMFRKAGNSQMFQIITIKDKQLLYRAYTATGELYDQFILEKRAGQSNTLTNKTPDTPEKR